MTLASSLIALTSVTAEIGQDNKSWIHLAPATGDVELRDGRRLFMPAIEAVIAETMRRAQGVPIVIDYDHQVIHSEKNGKPAPAAGWVQSLAARADGIWALVEWTAKAANFLRNKEYRFISPVYMHRPDGTIVSIANAGLTNSPAHSNLTALASLKDPMDPQMEAALAGLRALFGLPADAKPDAIYEAARALKEGMSATSAASAGLVPIELLEQATAEIRRLDGNRMSPEAASILVKDDIGRGRLLPFMKEWGVALCQENRKAYDDFVSKTSVGLQEALATRERRAIIRRTEDTIDPEISRNLGLAE